MKRIIVVTSDVPFVEGGHLTIARSTVRALRECGHQADLMLTPQNRFGRQFQAYWANRFTDVGVDGLGRPIHQVISFRFPSFAVKHPHHVCWLNHRLREYYDLWEMLYAQLGTKGRIKESLRRRFFHAWDTRLLKHNVSRVYAQSRTIQQRLEHWGRIPSQVLYPPPPQRGYRTEGYDNFIFSVSRLQKIKRLDLLIEAFHKVRSRDLKAYIIGEGPEAENLTALIKKYGLEKKVFLLGKSDEATVISLYARCRAVYFAPLREDYGFVTGEAFKSRKPVITTSDSGGPAELVNDGESGFIASPDPTELAECFDRLSDDPALAERLGGNAYAFISKITWEKTVEKLIT